MNVRPQPRATFDHARKAAPSGESGRRTGCRWWIFLSFLLQQPVQGLAQSFDRVGQGDARQGYDSTDYQTDSKRIAVQPGAAVDLEALAADPPLGLPGLENPPVAAHIHLGRRLFFDRRLSANSTLSCGMCHIPEQAFTQNELRTPVGIEGRLVKRNAPAIYNVAYRPILFHDGRERELSQQIWAPLLAENEMGNATRADVLRRIKQVDVYDKAFNELFDDGLTENNLGLALAAYQRSLVSANTPFDRWFFGGDTTALTSGAKRGFRIFRQSGCGSCHILSHAHAQFTDENFHNTGVARRSAALAASDLDSLQIAPGVTVELAVQIDQPRLADDGRMEATGLADDRWKFRTPTLRNVGVTQPYMHDGSFATLDEVIDYYNAGGSDDPAQNVIIRPLGLSNRDKHDLITFLDSLTGSNIDALAADARSIPIGDHEEKSSARSSPR